MWNRIISHYINGPSAQKRRAILEGRGAICPMAPPKIIPDNTLIFSGKTAQCI
jgi:hypothetical protein